MNFFASISFCRRLSSNSKGRSLGGSWHGELLGSSEVEGRTVQIRIVVGSRHMGRLITYAARFMQSCLTKVMYWRVLNVSLKVLIFHCLYYNTCTYMCAPSYFRECAIPQSHYAVGISLWITLGVCEVTFFFAELQIVRPQNHSVDEFIKNSH